MDDAPALIRATRERDLPDFDRIDAADVMPAVREIIRRKPA